MKQSCAEPQSVTAVRACTLSAQGREGPEQRKDRKGEKEKGAPDISRWNCSINCSCKIDDVSNYVCACGGRSGRGPWNGSWGGLSWDGMDWLGL